MLKYFFWLRCMVVLALIGGLQLAAAQTLKPAGAGKASSRRTEAQAAKTLRHASAPLEALSDEQLAVADRVALGKIPCELGARVSLKPDVRGAGRFVLELGAQRFAMVPVVSKTGAIRLEDEAAGVVWLQLANKSMLMSQKQGKRLADACVNADQLIVAKELELNPAPSLLDAPVRLQAVAQGATAASPEMAVVTDAVAK